MRGYGIQFGRGAGPVFEAVASEQKGILPWGADHHRVFRKLNGHRMHVSAICEDLPEEHNRVTLDPVLKDGHGIPAPKIDYTISENSRKMMEHGLARGREILEAAGATDICVNSPIPCGGWHLLGTARMGTDPARSVVNEWGRSHDVKNLFIVDGSVFVTSGRRQSDVHHPGHRALHRRPDEAAPRQSLRLRIENDCRKSSHLGAARRSARRSRA